MNYPKIPSFSSAAAFRAHLAEIGAAFSVDDAPLPAPESPLAAPAEVWGLPVGNRWAVLPMEGWDCLPDGAPSEFTRRRWLRFATSGAKLLFGCEACAVMPSGRSNTRQLMLTDATFPAVKALRDEMMEAHRAAFGRSDDFLVGLQLTHSGRYSHPNDDARLESVTAYSHPLLDEKFRSSPANVVADSEIPDIVAHFAKAAALAQKAGFAFVDVKMAHGYLGHEFLSAFTRPGPYGGTFENRTRFFREVVAAIRASAPGLHIGMRLSLFDCIPFEKGPDGVGRPMERGDQRVGHYDYAFGGDGTGLGFDLTEPVRFLELARSLGVDLVCTTACSPYYNPHFQRPAYFPVSDGYLPPEEPVLGADRQIRAVAEVKRHFEGTGMLFVGSGYTCLQDYLVHTAQAAVREGKTDFVGIGRMVLAYPDLPADTLAGRPVRTKSLCRTFGDCTTAPRHGLISGCYPLDGYYRCRPECEKLKEFKLALKNRAR